ncbi:MAG: hypothetical protein WCP70_06255 [Methanothrix sp.]
MHITLSANSWPPNPGAPFLAASPPAIRAQPHGQPGPRARAPQARTRAGTHMDAPKDTCLSANAKLGCSKRTVKHLDDRHGLFCKSKILQEKVTT